MVDKISVQIALEGGDEVAKQLADIGKAGDEAFAGVNEAGTTAAEGIAKAGEASQTTAEQFNTVQGSADKASESLRGVSLETVKTSAEILKLTAEIAKTGVEIGLVVARHRTLAQSLLHLARGANTAVKAIGLLAPELTAAAVAIAPVVVAVAGAVVAFEAIEKAVTAAASAYEKLNNSLQTLAKDTGQSFNSLQQGQAAFEQLGIGAEKYRDIITKISEVDVGSKIKESTDAALEAEKKLIELRQKSEGRELTFAEAGRLQEINDLLGTVTGSEKTLGEARDNAAKTSANSLATLLPIIQQIIAGSKDIKFDGLVTAESKINGVAIALKNAEQSGQVAGQALVKFIANADRASAIEVGKKFGITAEDVDRIQALGGKLGVVDQIWRRIQGAGVLIPPESAAAFERMRVSIQGVDSAWVRLKQSLSSSFFATEAAKLSGDLNTIKAAIINTAAAGVEAFGRMPSTISALTQELQALKTLVASFSWENLLNAVAKLGQLLGTLTIPGIVSQALQAIFGDAQKATQGVQQTGQALQQTGQAAQQAAQSFQIVPNPFTGMPEAIRTTTQALAQTGQAAEQAKQSFQIVSNPFTGMPEAINKTNQALQTTGQTGAQAFQQVGTAAETTQPTLSTFASTLASWNWDPIAAGVRVWNDITSAIQSAIDKLLKFIGLKPSAPATGDGAPGKASGGLLGGRGTGTSDSNLAWVSRGEHIMPARVVRQPGVLGLLEALRRGGGGIPGYADGGVVSSGASIRGQAVERLRNIFNAINTAMDALANSLNGVKHSLESSIGAISQSFDTVDRTMAGIQDAIEGVMNMLRPGGGAASGGLLGGRGTGTSDSNLAWVSRGEYITPAAAVAQPGVLAFLEALRRSGGNLSAVLNGMGRFALGGMVPRAMPAFAGGGLAGGNLGTLTLGLPSGGSVTVRASSGVADQLRKEAALAQVRSGGRKPSRYS
jgi:hypothetical protein